MNSFIFTLYNQSNYIKGHELRRMIQFKLNTYDTVISFSTIEMFKQLMQ